MGQAPPAVPAVGNPQPQIATTPEDFFGGMVVDAPDLAPTLAPKPPSTLEPQAPLPEVPTAAVPAVATPTPSSPEDVAFFGENVAEAKYPSWADTIINNLKYTGMNLATLPANAELLVRRIQGKIEVLNPQGEV